MILKITSSKIFRNLLSFFLIKTVDLEMKSERIQNNLLSIANKILIENESLAIQTPSFIFNLLKLSSSSERSSLDFRIQNSGFDLPRFFMPKITETILARVKRTNLGIIFIPKIKFFILY